MATTTIATSLQLNHYEIELFATLGNYITDVHEGQLNAKIFGQWIFNRLHFPTQTTTDPYALRKPINILISQTTDMNSDSKRSPTPSPSPCFSTIDANSKNINNEFVDGLFKYLQSLKHKSKNLVFARLVLQNSNEFTVTATTTTTKTTSTHCQKSRVTYRFKIVSEYDFFQQHSWYLNFTLYHLHYNLGTEQLVETFPHAFLDTWSHRICFSGARIADKPVCALWVARLMSKNQELLPDKRIYAEVFPDTKFYILFDRQVSRKEMGTNIDAILKSPFPERGMRALAFWNLISSIFSATRPLSSSSSSPPLNSTTSDHSQGRNTVYPNLGLMMYINRELKQFNCLLSSWDGTNTTTTTSKTLISTTLTAGPQLENGNSFAFTRIILMTCLMLPFIVNYNIYQQCNHWSHRYTDCITKILVDSLCWSQSDSELCSKLVACVYNLRTFIVPKFIEYLRFSKLQQHNEAAKKGVENCYKAYRRALELELRSELGRLLTHAGPFWWLQVFAIVEIAISGKIHVLNGNLEEEEKEDIDEMMISSGTIIVVNLRKWVYTKSELINTTTGQGPWSWKAQVSCDLPAYKKKTLEEALFDHWLKYPEERTKSGENLFIESYFLAELSTDCACVKFDMPVPDGFIRGWSWEQDQLNNDNNNNNKNKIYNTTQKQNGQMYQTGITYLITICILCLIDVFNQDLMDIIIIIVSVIVLHPHHLYGYIWSNHLLCLIVAMEIRSNYSIMRLHIN